MSDRAVENARRQRERLAEQINKAQQDLEIWRRQIARAEQFLADWEAFAVDTLPDPNLTLPGGDAIGSPSVKRTRRNSSKEEVARMARQIIEEAETPVSREELYDALIEMGLTIEGADRVGVMNTMLWRTRDEFGVIHIRNLGYWLRERELGGVDADPNSADVIADENKKAASHEAGDNGQPSEQTDNRSLSPPVPPSIFK